MVKHYILFYETVDNYVERRQPYRPEHLDMVKDFQQQGQLVMAGAFDAPADGAALVFKTEEAAQAFAQSDPYVKNGLITRWYIRQWNVVTVPS